jgi:site-specific recombinase XerD
LKRAGASTFNPQFSDMENHTFCVLFFVKRTKPLKNGDIPLFVRITVNGKRSEFSLGKGIPPSLWDAKKSRARGHSAVSREVNEFLTGVSAQFHEHHKELRESGRMVTTEILCDRFLGKDEKIETLKALYEQHNRRMCELIGIEYAPLTLQRYETGLKHVCEFMRVEFGSDQLQLREIDHKFINSFEHYLKAVAKCQHNSAMKHIKALKKVIGIAVAEGYIRTNPFSKYKVSVRHVEKEFLTEGEMSRMAEKKLDLERIAIVRDLFLFQCLTGLAYSDLAKLTPSDIQAHVDGQLWVITDRTKTGVPCRIPLLPMALEIMHRYTGHVCRLRDGLLFPVPTNQKMNAYLKEVGDLCGIKKDLTTHMARHTFATTVTLSNGIPIETVSKMLGHRKLQSTQIYAKVLDDKVANEMNALRGRF